MRWVSAGETMLGTYGTAVMMLCLYATCPLLNIATQFLTLPTFSLIHVYLAIEALRTGGFELPTIVWQSSACPDCQHYKLDHRSVSVAGHRIGFPGNVTVYPHDHGNKDIHQPFIQGGDDEEGSRDSSEYQTSGFNSPRQSAETLATEFQHDNNA
jgi:hypothetical protein